MYAYKKEDIECTSENIEYWVRLLFLKEITVPLSPHIVIQS